MTTDQMMQACQAIGDISLRMRAPGNWYVDHRGVERVEGSLLSGGLVSADNPQHAIGQHWAWLTDDKYPVIRIWNYGTVRRVKWNGFMWEDVKTVADGSR